MSDLLGIGSTGVRAYQSALSVIGENIANATTKGYARRDPTLIEQTGGAGRQIYYATNTIGQGVAFTGVLRQWDDFRAAEVRTSTAEAGRTNSTIVWLDRIEKALSGASIGGALTKFFNAAEGVAADPTGIAPRTAMLDAAGGVASAFTTTANGLATIENDLRASAQLAVNQLNNFASGLAEANAGLSRVRAGSNEQAQLLDQRDRMIDALSELSTVHVAMDERGIATVRLGDQSGPVLVQGSETKPLRVDFNASGAMALTLDAAANPTAVAIRGGTIAGFVEASARLTDTRDQVTSLAQAVATGVNQVQASGVDLDAQPGGAIFDAGAGDGTLALAAIGPRQIAAARPWTVSSTAGNRGGGGLVAATNGSPLPQTRITISGGVLTATDPVTNNVIGSAPYTVGTPVTLAGLDITVSGNPADGDSFTIGATGTGSRDNGNLQGFAALRASGRFESQADDLVTANASALSAKKQVAEAQGVILEGALAARDTRSGVNLDQEAVELMRYQQAYSATSRIIQVARDTFDSLLQAVG
jgi:flagellar hook-associated protein 1